MIDHGPLSPIECAVLAHIGGDQISEGVSRLMAEARSQWTGLLLRLEDRGLIRFVDGYVLTERGRAVLEGRGNV